MRRNNRLPLTITVIVVALLAIFVGYLIGNWVLQMVVGSPEEHTERAGKKIIKEEIIRDESSEDNEQRQTESDDDSESSQLDSQNSNNDIETNSNNITEKEFIINDKNTPKDVFVVQVGAFNKYNNALTLKKELESKGFQVVVTEGVPYKVQLGASTNRNESEKVEQEVESMGYNAFITH